METSIYVSMIRGLKTFGYCSNRKKLIVVSYDIFQEDSGEAYDTLLHEIAHAIVYMKGYTREGHGYIWRQQAIACGADPNRLKHFEAIHPAVFKHGVIEEEMFIERCPTCGKQWSISMQVAKNHMTKPHYCHDCRLRYGFNEKSRLKMLVKGLNDQR